jgi:parvulin-like peptidyl-prolyl isomerase
MKKSALFVLVFMLIANLYGQMVQADRPVAVVKLHKTEVLPLTKYRLYEKTMKHQKQDVDLTQEEKVQLLNVLINQMLVRQDAEKLNITVNDSEVLPAAMKGLSLELQQMQMIPAGAQLTDPEQFKQLLLENGHDYDLYLENTRNSLLIERYITQTKRSDFENIPAPDAKTIEAFYNKYSTQFAQPEYVLISQIFFAASADGSKDMAKKKAEDTYRKVTGGQLSFDSAVKETGDDFPFTQIKGQPFTVVRSDEQAVNFFGNSFTDDLFAGKEVSRIYLMESTAGFHIVKINDHKMPGILTLDDRINPMEGMTVRDYLTQIIMNQLSQQLYAKLQQDVISDLRAKADVNTFEDAL